VSGRAGEVECTGEEERERECVCDLNDVGPKRVEIGSTGQTVVLSGQTGLAQADEQSWLSDLLREFWN